MADVDNDWDEFMSAAAKDYGDKPDEDEDIDDDELEDDEDADDEQEDKPKKPTKKASKKAADAAEEDDEDESDEDDDDDSEDDEDESEEEDDESKTSKSTYKPRLKQFFDDKGKPDLKKYEEGYINSSKEAVRLNGELKAERDARVESQGNFTNLAKAIQKNDPDLAKKIFDGDTLKELDKKPAADAPKDPFTRDYEAKLRKQSKAEYDQFIELNPKAVTDPSKADKIGAYLKLYGEWYKEQNDGEIPSMKDALEATYRHFGWDAAKEKKEKVATAAKKTAANRSSGGGKKVAKKSEVSKMESVFAKKLGVKL